MEIQGSGFSAGLGAIQSGQRMVEKAAGEIASSTVAGADSQQPADLTTILLALEAGKVQAEAGSMVAKATDQMIGSLIDTFA
ncbi:MULTISPECIES: hypothetical protein [unclassified Pseudomonas]|uniref:hypothetical protein n=1 Tax=unclassified Pseudomonas TaxID=196821 RepID=UPI002454FFF2|nr:MULTISPECIES: hypothetical protein [unclassified Pseudomonas]MDH4560809.1 hypothetical protein [Pseudomonas sp. BN411]MDH4870140.1 hypothetical protein [Pseudomonas sp. BN515]